MRIVGVEHFELDAGDIHTIDVWFSKRRGVWMIERLNASGDRMGVAHACAAREDAEACLGEWLRAHGEAHLVGSEDAARRRKMRRAA